MSGYADGGASTNKKTLKSWLPRHGSAKSDVDYNLKLLRARAADLALNSPLGAAAIQTMVTGVIGDGLKVFPRIRGDELGLTVEEARAWSRRVKAEFELWAGQCDYLRRNTFAELQIVAFEAQLIDGDSFILFKREPPTEREPYTLRLQVVEAGRIATPPGGVVEQRRGTNRIVNGIEVDAQGRQAAIWVSNRLWDEVSLTEPELTWQRVEWYGTAAGYRNVLHLCKDTRPDQFRGVPLLAPAIESLKQVSRYADSELTGSIIRSLFSIFFTQQQTLGINETLGEELDVSDFKLGSPSVMALPAGVDVKAIGNQNAQSTFEAFTTAFVKQVAAAIGLPFEVLMKHFQSSYSASRAALQEAANTYRQRKAAFIADFCKPIYEQFMIEAVSTGRVTAEGFAEPLRRQAWLAADWYSETPHFIDPVKEAQASLLRLNNGLTTYRKELAETSGLDFDEVAEQIKEERALSGVRDGRQ